jgi:hypothetical protein
MRVILAIVQQSQRLELRLLRRTPRKATSSFRCSILWTDGLPFRQNLAITVAVAMV